MDGKDVIELAAQCGVHMNKACRRAGIAGSTPWRWSRGAEAHPETVARLERAVIELASEAGTVPPDLAARAKSVLARKIEQRRHPREIIHDLKRGLRELEQVTGS